MGEDSVVTALLGSCRRESAVFALESFGIGRTTMCADVSSKPSKLEKKLGGVFGMVSFMNIGYLNGTAREFDISTMTSEEPSLLAIL